MTVRLCISVSDEEAAAIFDRAAEEGVANDGALRRAVEVWFASKVKTNVTKNGRTALNAAAARADSVVKNCEHPESRIMQTGNGVVCDKCGTWL